MLYTFSLGLATAITPQSQLKAELLDTNKSEPPAGAQSNDVALLLSLVFNHWPGDAALSSRGRTSALPRVLAGAQALPNDVVAGK